MGLYEEIIQWDSSLSQTEFPSSLFVLTNVSSNAWFWQYLHLPCPCPWNSHVIFLINFFPWIQILCLTSYSDHMSVCLSEVRISTCERRQIFLFQTLMYRTKTCLEEKEKCFETATNRTQLMLIGKWASQKGAFFLRNRNKDTDHLIGMVLEEQILTECLMTWPRESDP